MSVPSPDVPTATAASAEDLDAIRRRVVNVVGHELRTPATTIRGLARAITDATDLTAVTGELGPALLRNAERLTALLDDLLMASGITSAVPVGVAEPVAVGELLADRWRWLSGEELDLIDPATTTALVPREALVRAVDPVLANAHQYGSGPPHVVVSEDGEQVRVAVHSPGPPLHPEEVRLATEAFFRGEVAVTTRPGLGVGLAVARTVLGRIGGGLSVTAEDGGLVTVLDLPAEGAR